MRRGSTMLRCYRQTTSSIFSKNELHSKSDFKSFFSVQSTQTIEGERNLGIFKITCQDLAFYRPTALPTPPTRTQMKAFSTKLRSLRLKIGPISRRQSHIQPKAMLPITKHKQLCRREQLDKQDEASLIIGGILLLFVIPQKTAQSSRVEIAISIA